MAYTSKTFNPVSASAVMLFATILALTGCGHGNGQGLDSDGDLAAASDLGNQSAGNDSGGGDSGGTAGASGNPNARLAWVQDNVFGGVCSQCHTGAGAPLGVNWSSQSNTCSNIDRPSGEITSMMEIKSGFPDESYVIWKVEGQGPNGEPIAAGTVQMPAGNPALTTDTIQNMRDWIADGTPGCSASKPSASQDSTGTEYVLGSWDDVWNESLRICTICHSDNASSARCSSELDCPPKGVVLTEDSYATLVDSELVTPFDPENSLLWQRVNSNDHTTRMPLGFAALTQYQLNIIRQWIEDGARDCPQDQACR